MSLIITFMLEPAKLQMNWARARGTSALRKALESTDADSNGHVLTASPAANEAPHRCSTAAGGVPPAAKLLRRGWTGATGSAWEVHDDRFGVHQGRDGSGGLTVRSGL
jgi:hypothetical protein